MININEIEFKSLSKVNNNELFEFYSIAFPQRNNIIFKNWKWIYRTSLFGLEPFVAIYKKRLIGHAGAISTNIFSSENIFQGIWFVDFYILPEFRNIGLGKVMTKKWMSLEKNHLTICNDQSLRVFRKLGWVENKNYYKSCKLFNPLKWLPIINLIDNRVLDKMNLFKYLNKTNFTKKATFLKLSENKKKLTELANLKINNNKKDSSNVQILRDDNWLSWRLFESPFINFYYFFFIENSFVIVSIYKEKHKKKLNIIFSQYENQDYEIVLNENIIKWSVDNNVDIVWLNINNLEKNINLTKFYSKNFKINFACNSSNSFLDKNVLKQISNLEAIDSDSDILSYNNLNSINK